MRTLNRLLLLCSITILFTGCKHNDDDLCDKINDRITALDQWQMTVNGNITALQNLVMALQNNDYVSNVTTFTTPAPGGYKITFNKNGETTIWNGANDADGQNAPVIGVTEYPEDSKIYYWTLNGEFIEKNGEKMLVTNAKGSTETSILPKLQINTTTDYWEISYDNGITWISLNIKVTDPQGDIIFAKNGINDTDDYFVVFTLADSNNTTIKLPKFNMVFTVDVPSELKIPQGATRTFAITNVDNISSVAITKPDGWQVSINSEMTELMITAPDTSNPHAETEGIISLIASNTSGLTITIPINVFCGPVYSDGEVVEIERFSATDVNIPINLVIVGDGFTETDYIYGGTFDTAVDKAVEAFFSVEPYPTYRKYFTVYKVAAYSQQSGATVLEDFYYQPEVKKQTRKTVFNSVLEGGLSTSIDCNYNAVFTYAQKVDAINEKDIPNTTILVIINLDVRAGTAWMWRDGAAIALCPTGDTFSPIVFHECSGHAFAKLYDEYVYNDGTYPDEDIATLEQFRQGDPWFFAANLSLTNNLANVHWKHYFTKTGYEMVGVYEGGDRYEKGIWRPEEMSGMNDETIPYFNAPSREAIVRRIMTINGKGFNRDDFYAKDKTDYPIIFRKSIINKVPLSTPVLMHHR